MTKPTKPSRGRGPRAIAIIALVFAPIALLLSASIYTRDTPIDRTPLLIGAGIVGALEIAAAVLTLLKKPLGPRLFVVYGVAALLFVIVDGVMFWQLITYPEPETHRDLVSGLGHAAVGLLGILFHFAWAVASMAWPIAAMVLGGRWKPRADFFGTPAVAPAMPAPLTPPTPVGVPGATPAFSLERPSARPSAQPFN